MAPFSPYSGGENSRTAPPRRVARRPAFEIRGHVLAEIFDALHRLFMPHAAGLAGDLNNDFLLKDSIGDKELQGFRNSLPLDRGRWPPLGGQRGSKFSAHFSARDSRIAFSGCVRWNLALFEVRNHVLAEILDALHRLFMPHTAGLAGDLNNDFLLKDSVGDKEFQGFSEPLPYSTNVMAPSPWPSFTMTGVGGCPFPHSLTNPYRVLHHPDRKRSCRFQLSEMGKVYLRSWKRFNFWPRPARMISRCSTPVVRITTRFGLISR